MLKPQRTAGLAAALVAAVALPFALPLGASQESFPGQCRDVSAQDAAATGSAVALQVIGGPLGDQAFAEVAAEQQGPGMTHDDDRFLEVAVPADGSLVRATVLKARTDLQVEADPLESQAWSSAAVVDLDVLDGLLTAQNVRAATYSVADVRHAHTDTTASTLQNVQLQGVALSKAAMASNVTLPEALFGPGSFVAFHERIDTSSTPSHGDPFWRAEVAVRMIHVKIADSDPVGLGLTPLEIIVAEAKGMAESPTPFCGLLQAVDASGYVARVRPNGTFEDVSLLHGWQDINVTGGSGHQQVFGMEFPAGRGSAFAMNWSETRVDGVIDPGTDSRARAMTKVSGVCILSNGTVLQTHYVEIEDDLDCLVSFQMVRVESNSYADATAAFSWGAVEILHLVVAGVDVCEEMGMAQQCRPPPNTRFEIGGVEVVLNEREFDPDMPGHTGLYVRAIRLVSPDLGMVIVGRAYSSADFFDVNDAVATHNP